MSIFSKIWDKLNDPWGIQDKHRAETAGTNAAAAKPAPAAAPANSPPVAKPQAAPAPAPTAAQPVDVQAILTDLAAKKGGGGNWRTSIADLLRLLDLDSSLTARKELADELGVRAGADGSAEQNIALHKAVLRKLAENGGKVPKELLD